MDCWGEGKNTLSYLSWCLLVLGSNLLDLGNLQYYGVVWLGTRGRNMAGVKSTMATCQ